MELDVTSIAAMLFYEGLKKRTSSNFSLWFPASYNNKDVANILHDGKMHNIPMKTKEKQIYISVPNEIVICNYINNFVEDFHQIFMPQVRGEVIKSSPYIDFDSNKYSGVYTNGVAEIFQNLGFENIDCILQHSSFFHYLPYHFANVYGGHKVELHFSETGDNSCILMIKARYGFGNLIDNPPIVKVQF